MRWLLVAALASSGCGIDIPHRMALTRRIELLGDAAATGADNPRDAAALRAEAAALASDVDAAVR